MIAMFITACGSFSPRDKEKIGSGNDGIMRLWTTESVEDSLFLRQPAAELSGKQVKAAEFATLRDRMLLTVTDPENTGVGIAAPQVGLPYRLVAVQRFDKEGEPFEFYINPRIVHYSDETRGGREGCLSVPDMSGMVDRSASIEITYLDERTLKTVGEKISGFTAVIFQHEIDHLDGILYTDRASEISKD